MTLTDKQRRRLASRIASATHKTRADECLRRFSWEKPEETNRGKKCHTFRTYSENEKKPTIHFYSTEEQNTTEEITPCSK